MHTHLPSPTSARPPAIKGPPPKPVWPSQAEQLAAVRALGVHRCADAFERYRTAKQEAQAWQHKSDTLRHWPSEPALLHPDLQSSTRRRLDEEQLRQQARHKQVEELYQAYRAQQAAAAQLEEELSKLSPPPRLVDLLGGPEAFLALPVVRHTDGAASRGRTQDPVAVELKHMGQAPIVRGQDRLGRLYVAIAFSRPAPCAPGVVTLYQAEPQPACAWLMLNPDRFVPPGGSYRGNLAPVLPNMAGRSALVGGPDARMMLGALGALVAEGRRRPSGGRLGATAGVQATDGVLAPPQVCAAGATAPGPSEARAL